MTLPGTLRLGFLCRSGAILLECVAEAHSCPWVQQTIRRFASITGYGISQGVCQLQTLWPAKRNRWWCILTHPALGSVPWVPMPISTAMPIVADVLDQFHACTESEMQQLALDLYELGRFAAHGFERNELPWKGQMQTSLHSCGSQLTGCPCGCRKFAFHDDRLAQKGLHGILIRLQGCVTCGSNTYPCYRHIHPAELALLNGMLPDMPWGDQAMKLSLCALGQLASPIQSTWVGSLLMRHIQCIQESPSVIDPHVNLLTWMEKVLASRDAFFGPQTNPNAKHFNKLIHTRVFATKMPSKPTGTDKTDQPNVMPRLAEETETAHAGDRGGADSKRPTVIPGDAMQTQPPVSTSGVKRDASEFYHAQSTDSMPAHVNGGVHGFQNKACQETKVA